MTRSPLPVILVLFADVEAHVRRISSLQSGSSAYYLPSYKDRAYERQNQRVT